MLSDLSTNDYFFYGYPSIYALVGVHDRRIWLVLDSESAAHELRTAFSSKISLVIFNLTTFKNYHKNLIDNSVCLSWSVPVEEYVSNSIIKKIVNPTFTNTHVSASGGELSNTVPFFNFLSQQSQTELQQQMMFYYYLVYNVFGSADTMVPDFPISELDNIFDREIKTIFSTELTLSDIKATIISTANQLLGNDNLTTRSRNRAFYILRLFDKLYG